MSPRLRLRRVDAFVVLAIAVPAIPIIVAVIRAIADRWIPLGDQALLEIRARDVLTIHHPWLGTASSAALNRSEPVPLNHPGPLMFDVLAVPVRVFGDAGVAIGAGAVNLAAAVIGTLFASRRSGRAGVGLAALAFTALGWAAGSESLFDPYNPTAAMLPCLACLFVAWSVIDLDGWAVPWLLAVATFAVQLNNSYLLFLTPLVVVACTAFAVRARRAESAGLRTVTIAAVAVVVVLWSQPLVEQLLHGRDGNMARMLRAAGVLRNHPGLHLGTQIAAATLALPPWWWRSKFDGIRLFSHVPHIVLATVSLVIVVLVCAVGCWWAGKRHTADAATALATAAISAAIGWAAATRSPMSSFFGVSSEYVRWLWPVSAVRVVRRRVGPVAPHRCAPEVRRPPGAPVRGHGVDHRGEPRQRATSHQPREPEGVGSACVRRPSDLIDTATDNIDATSVLYRPPPNYDVFGVPLLARLQSQGVEFFVDDPVLVRQFGERRRYRGQDLAELHVLTAMDAVDAAGDPNLVALVSQLSAGERSDLESMIPDVAAWLADGRVTLSAKGKAAVAVGFGGPWLGQLGDPEIDATTISRSNELGAAIEAGLLDADSTIMATLQQFAALRQSVETSTAAVLLIPSAHH